MSISEPRSSEPVSFLQARSDSRLLFDVRANYSTDILGLQNLFRVPMSRYGQHGPPDLLRGQHVIGKGQAEQGQQWFAEHVKDPIEGRFGARSVKGLDDARTKHERCCEWQAK